MLYDRWRQVVRSRKGEMALLDLGSGRRWTFGELANATHDAPAAGDVIYPAGNSAEFVFAVLKGWRLGRVVCPLEAEQARPEAAGTLPPGTVHLKKTSGTS